MKKIKLLALLPVVLLSSCSLTPNRVRYDSDIDDMAIEVKDGIYYVTVEDGTFEVYARNTSIFVDNDDKVVFVHYTKDKWTDRFFDCDDKLIFHTTLNYE